MEDIIPLERKLASKQMVRKIYICKIIAFNSLNAFYRLNVLSLNVSIAMMRVNMILCGTRRLL